MLHRFVYFQCKNLCFRRKRVIPPESKTEFGDDKSCRVEAWDHRFV